LYKLKENNINYITLRKKLRKSERATVTLITAKLLRTVEYSHIVFFESFEKFDWEYEKLCSRESKSISFTSLPCESVSINFRTPILNWVVGVSKMTMGCDWFVITSTGALDSMKKISRERGGEGRGSGRDRCIQGQTSLQNTRKLRSHMFRVQNTHYTVFQL
jgi:hypothetical protein